MADIFQPQVIPVHPASEPIPQEREDASRMKLNPGGIALLAILILLIPGSIAAVIISHRESTVKKSFAANNALKATDMNSTKNLITKVQTSDHRADQAMQKTTSQLPGQAYSDPDFGYSLSIPQDWETFKRASDNTGYQLGIRPKGSTDVPIVVNAYKNTQGILSEDVINSRFGEGYPRDYINWKGGRMIHVLSDGYESYFLANKSHIYELSDIAGNQTYHSVFQQILSSFAFR